MMELKAERRDKICSMWSKLFRKQQLSLRGHGLCSLVHYSQKETLQGFRITEKRTQTDSISNLKTGLKDEEKDEGEVMLSMADHKHENCVHSWLAAHRQDKSRSFGATLGAWQDARPKIVACKKKSKVNGVLPPEEPCARCHQQPMGPKGPLPLLQQGCVLRWGGGKEASPCQGQWSSPAADKGSTALWKQ